MGKYYITDKLDSIVKTTKLIIDDYQVYEITNANLKSVVRNYIDDNYSRSKYIEILEMKKNLEVLLRSFKEFKKEYQNEFDVPMQYYFDKYHIYIESVMLAIDNRTCLQNALSTNKGTLFGNISLMYKIKNAINQCLRDGLEVNKIVTQIQKSA